MAFTCSREMLWPSHPGLETQEMVPSQTSLLASDIFVDACGNNYRAYWPASFEGPIPKGRTQVEKVGQQFKGQFETGPTSGVPLGEFLFLTSLQDDEAVSVQELRYQAFRKGFKLKDFAFER